MRTYRPDSVIVETGSEKTSLFRNIMRALPDTPVLVVEDAEKRWASAIGRADPMERGKRHLIVARQKGEFLKKCPGSDGQVCCNYFVLNFASNCPMECSYCYLQDYLADNPALKVYSNVDDLLGEADLLLRRHRGHFFRIGTGEIADSLALDDLIGFTTEVVPFFAEQPNVLLELKTKSNVVENLLPINPKERVVVSWSMNPQRLIDADEKLTASLEERIEAASRCQQAGYKLGFHFDPMVEYPGWELDYEDMVEQIFTAVDHKRVAWVSMGVLRATPALKRAMRRRFPQTTILSGEQVFCPDGKARYFQPLRVKMYRKMLGWIRRASPTVFVYLCMESREVWEQVFGFFPACEKELGSRMTADA